MRKLFEKIKVHYPAALVHAVPLALPLIFLVIFAVASFFLRGSMLHSVIHHVDTDTFMDYFNMLYNVKHGDPYYANANYPAINFLILKILLHFAPLAARPTTGSPGEQAWVMRESMPMLLPFIVFVLICLLVIAFCIRKMVAERSRAQQNLIVASALLSAPMLFLLERGNLLILALALLFVFVAYGKSENPYVRYLSCAALALSAAMKLYPAVFVLLLLRRKQYREFVFTAVLGTILLIWPFFLWGGLLNQENARRDFHICRDGLGFGD